MGDPLPISRVSREEQLDRNPLPMSGFQQCCMFWMMENENSTYQEALCSGLPSPVPGGANPGLSITGCETSTGALLTYPCRGRTPDMMR
jgi:hypothetical protein